MVAILALVPYEEAMPTLLLDEDPRLRDRHGGQVPSQTGFDPKLPSGDLVPQAEAAASPASDLGSTGVSSAATGAGSGGSEGGPRLPAPSDGSASPMEPVPEQPEAGVRDAEGGDEAASPTPASEQCKAVRPDEELCAFCFRAVLARLHCLPLPVLTGPWLEDAESLVAGLFVTWKTPPAGLRGCMGSLSPVKLEKGLTEFALTSALEDKRFKPMRAAELARLTCRVSLLHSFEPCDDAYDWKVGVHGLQVAFTRSSLGFSTTFEAVFLPEVMVEAGLTHELALSKLVYKAGYLGPCDKALIKRIKATRFQSYACECRYSDLAAYLP